jgi:hypothetical protein
MSYSAASFNCGGVRLVMSIASFDAARPRRRGDRVGYCLLRCMSPVVAAPNGHAAVAASCPLLRDQWTLAGTRLEVRV